MTKNWYFLWPILLFASMDVSRHILELDTYVLVKSNMGQKEYHMLNIIGIYYTTHNMITYYI
jgi:hypothetical protein